MRQAIKAEMGLQLFEFSKPVFPEAILFESGCHGLTGD